MAKTKATLWGAAIVTLLAWLGLYFLLIPRPPGVNLAPHRAAGEWLATEAIRQLSPGGRLLILARVTEDFQMPVNEAQMEAFLAAVKKAGQAAPTLRGIAVDPLRLTAAPAGDFFDLIRQAKDTDVIVSFLGPPGLSPDQLATLGAKRTKTVALCPRSTPAELKTAFEQHFLTAALVLRKDAPVEPTGSTTVTGFEQTYEVLTAAPR